MTKNPRFQPFNDLPASQYEALKRDIERRGQILPIVVDENGVTIDGHQRRRACAELHIECAEVVLVGLSDEEKTAAAIVLNAFRRHLTGVERSKAITELAHLGMSNRRIAAAIGVSEGTVRNDKAKSGAQDYAPDLASGVDAETGEIVGGGGEAGHAEDGASSDSTAPTPPTPAPPKVTGRDGRQYPASKPAATWTDDELERKAELEAGRSVVVNLRQDAALIAWAESEGLLVRVDRKSAWGNPFLLPDDGDRDAVCDAYAKHYWPYKPSLHAEIDTLAGKALACWCYPERCHADHLADMAAMAVPA